MAHRIVLVGVAAATFAAGAALAAGPGQRMQHGGMPYDFEDMDRNGDGQITREEMAQHRAARFESADTDGDGKLSAAEMEARAVARMKDRIARMIARFDSDGDGMISAEEMPGPKRGARMFDRIDADNSGGVSRAEFDAAHDRHQARHRRHGQGQDGKKRRGSSD